MNAPFFYFNFARRASFAYSTLEVYCIPSSDYPLVSNTGLIAVKGSGEKYSSRKYNVSVAKQKQVKQKQMAHKEVWLSTL